MVAHQNAERRRRPSGRRDANRLGFRRRRRHDRRRRIKLRRRWNSRSRRRSGYLHSRRRRHFFEAARFHSPVIQSDLRLVQWRDGGAVAVLRRPRRRVERGRRRSRSGGGRRRWSERRRRRGRGVVFAEKNRQTRIGGHRQRCPAEDVIALLAARDELVMVAALQARNDEITVAVGAHVQPGRRGGVGVLKIDDLNRGVGKTAVKRLVDNLAGQKIVHFGWSGGRVGGSGPTRRRTEERPSSVGCRPACARRNSLPRRGKRPSTRHGLECARQDPRRGLPHRIGRTFANRQATNGDCASAERQRRRRTLLP